jgi:hypothetical protein
MSKSKKFILGIFTFLPLVFFGLYIFNFFAFFNGFNSVIQTQDPIVDPGLLAGNFQILFLFGILMAISGLGITIYYAVHTNKRKDFDSNKKLIWTLIILFTSGIGSIAYYFVEILPMPGSRNEISNEDSR